MAPGVGGVPHQGALCRLIGVGPLLFLNRKTEKPWPRIWLVLIEVAPLGVPHMPPRPVSTDLATNNSTDVRRKIPQISQFAFATATDFRECYCGFAFCASRDL